MRILNNFSVYKCFNGEVCTWRISGRIANFRWEINIYNAANQCITIKDILMCFCISCIYLLWVLSVFNFLALCPSVKYNYWTYEGDNADVTRIQLSLFGNYQFDRLLHVGFGIWLACVEHCYVLCLAANVSGYSQSQRTYSDGAIGSRTELRSYGSIAWWRFVILL